MLQRPDISLIASRHGARMAAHSVKTEVKQLRSRLKAAIVTLRRQRKEVIANARRQAKERAAHWRAELARVRRQRDAEKAARRKALTESLKRIDAEIAREREALRDLTPKAREYLREIMLRGHDMASARHRLAGHKSSAKQKEKLSEILTEIIDNLHIDRYRAGVPAKMREFIAAWLRRRAPKGATTAMRQGYYDPQRPASPTEQFEHWIHDNREEWQALLSQWGETLADEMIAERDANQDRIEHIAREAAQLLSAAERCPNPFVTVPVSQLIGDLERIDPSNSREVAILERELEEAKREVKIDCTPKKRTVFRKEAADYTKPPRPARKRQRKPADLAKQLRALADSAGQVRLAAVKAADPAAWPKTSAAIKELAAAGKIHLYREDNNAKLTPADTAAAVLVGGEPRHIAVVDQPKPWKRAPQRSTRKASPGFRTRKVRAEVKAARKRPTIAPAVSGKKVSKSPWDKPKPRPASTAAAKERAAEFGRIVLDAYQTLRAHSGTPLQERVNVESYARRQIRNSQEIVDGLDYLRRSRKLVEFGLEPDRSLLVTPDHAPPLRDVAIMVTPKSRRPRAAASKRASSDAAHAPPAPAQDDRSSVTEIAIEYGAIPNANENKGGFVPQLWVNQKPQLPAMSARGYTLETAIKLAELAADEEEQHWRGDYRPIITRRDSPQPKPARPKRAAEKKR